MFNTVITAALETATNRNMVVDASQPAEDFEAWHAVYSKRFSKQVAVWNSECPWWDMSYVTDKLPEGWELVAHTQVGEGEKYSEPTMKVIVARKGVWQSLCVEAFNSLNKAPPCTIGCAFASILDAVAA